MNDSPAAKAAVLEELRARIRRLEGRERAAGHPGPQPWPGAEALARGALHELRPDGALDYGAALAWAALLLGRCAPAGPLVWLSRTGGELYGPGLAALGLPWAQLLVVRPRDEREVLWALAECLATPGVGGVVGEVDALFKYLRRPVTKPVSMKSN